MHFLFLSPAAPYIMMHCSHGLATMTRQLTIVLVKMSQKALACYFNTYIENILSNSHCFIRNVLLKKKNVSSVQ